MKAAIKRLGSRQISLVWSDVVVDSRSIYKVLEQPWSNGWSDLRRLCTRADLNLSCPRGTAGVLSTACLRKCTPMLRTAKILVTEIRESRRPTEVKILRGIAT